MSRHFYVQIPQESVQYLKLDRDTLEGEIYRAILATEVLNRPTPIFIGAGRAIVFTNFKGDQMANEEPTVGNEPPENGWWPEEAFAPMTQMLFRRGKAIGNVVRTSVGWRIYSLIEMNNSGTGGLPLTKGSVKERSTARKQVEEYADRRKS